MKAWIGISRSYDLPYNFTQQLIQTGFYFQSQPLASHMCGELPCCLECCIDLCYFTYHFSLPGGKNYLTKNPIKSHLQELEDQTNSLHDVGRNHESSLHSKKAMNLFFCFILFLRTE